MIKLEKTKVYGLEEAIRGMRNPKNSWDRSDSYWTHIENPETGNTANFEFFVGDNDLELMKTLAEGGPVHAKYRRMITVYVDITAPLYWWKEFDTYKIGTVANSCSTMHKLPDKEFTLEDFSIEHLDEYGMALFEMIIGNLNANRDIYNNGVKSEDGDIPAGDKDIWWQMIQILPSSYNQKRTVMLNYEVLAGIFKWRKNHKLDEWLVFCDWIKTLPYSEIITGYNTKLAERPHEVDWDKWKNDLPSKFQASEE